MFLFPVDAKQRVRRPVFGGHVSVAGVEASLRERDGSVFRRGELRQHPAHCASLHAAETGGSVRRVHRFQY